MKKIVCAAVALAMLAPINMFAARKERSKKSSGKVTLKVWESDDSARKYVEWAAKEFMKSHKNVKIEYEHVESTDARAKIELDGPAGVGADVFVAPHDHIGALVNGGHVAENTNKDYLSQFVNAAQVASKYNGKTYGYPIGIETYALFYNKDLIPNPPKTWDEVIAYAKKFNNDAERKYALVWPVADGYFDYMFMSSYGAQLFGPNGNDRKQHNINSPEAIKGLQYFQSLRKQILNVPSADMTGDFCDSSFTQGKAAMFITGPWKIEAFSRLGLNYGIAPLPAFPGMSQPATSFSGVRLAFVSSYTEHPAEAAEFADFLTQKANLEKRFALTKQIPPRKDITTNDPLSNGILEQTKYAIPMPTIPQMNTYWSAMGAAYAGIWDGDDVVTDLNSAAASMDSAK
ncbi:MAG: maltose ABC transporter substrate-binding protein [Treponema sp.]|jgi:arabinogalactan oligomer/maltooligosaccharide transport system substrate-binding protein|uniref:sugar ABC transporter substrate-binding protein n=1 Tax=Treponema sp. TaxID=166 RepID=UPI002A90D85A|nr:maltose ABC transporter substrate-binding protein [Treponema sp.]MDY6396824.1 maltose ABC transporter substrate-binding protein [Treponema sp.]